MEVVVTTNTSAAWVWCVPNHTFCWSIMYWKAWHVFSYTNTTLTEGFSGRMFEHFVASLTRQLPVAALTQHSFLAGLTQHLILAAFTQYHPVNQFTRQFQWSTMFAVRFPAITISASIVFLSVFISFDISWFLDDKVFVVTLSEAAPHTSIIVDKKRR